MGRARKYETDWKLYIRRFWRRLGRPQPVRPKPKVFVPRLNLDFIVKDEMKAARKLAKKEELRKTILEYQARIHELFRIYGGPDTSAGAKQRKARRILPDIAEKMDGKKGKKVTVKVKRKKHADNVAVLPFVL